MRFVIKVQHYQNQPDPLHTHIHDPLLIALAFFLYGQVFERSTLNFTSKQQPKEESGPLKSSYNEKHLDYIH